MYYISFRECKLWYLYVRKTHGWKQEQFITIKVTRKVIGIVILNILFTLIRAETLYLLFRNFELQSSAEIMLSQKIFPDK